MNEQLPPFEEQNQSFGDLSEFDARQSTHRLTRTSWIGIAAGAVLLAGGAGGFLWVSSNPGSEDASAFTIASSGAVSTPAATSTPSFTGSVPFTGSGRDLFAGGATADSTSADGATATATSTQSLVGTGSGYAAGVVTGTTSPDLAEWLDYLDSLGKTAGGATATSTAPAGTTPTAGTSPTATGSPTWTVPVVRFVTDVDDDTARFNVGGELVDVDEGELIFPLNVRYEGMTAAAGSAILTSADNANTGWLVPVDEALPAAAVGGTADRVRVYGVVSDGGSDEAQYWVSVNRRPGVAYKAFTAVDGTPLSYIGTSVDDDSHKGVWFQDEAGVRYFGSFGAGEADGVSF